MHLEPVLIGLLILVLIMAAYTITSFRKPAWFGKAIIGLIVLLIALSILQVVMGWSTSETEPITIEPLARSQPLRNDA